MKKSLMLLPILLALGTFPAFAQVQSPASVPRVGFIHSNTSRNLIKILQQKLEELGYTEGKNIAYENKFVKPRSSRMSEVAADMVRLKPDVIVAMGTPWARAGKRATRTIPIVIVTLGNPVTHGLVESFARPGGNITGVTGNSQDFRIKLVELFNDTFRNISRIAVIKHPRNRWRVEMESTASSRGVKLQMVNARNIEEIKDAFLAIKRDKAEGVMQFTDLAFIKYAKRIVDIANKSRLPTIYERRIYVDKGGLMSYGPNILDLYRRAAFFVDKIIKGVKPKDLPIERANKGEIVINLKTAKKQGFTIPPEVLMFSDEVIR